MERKIKRENLPIPMWIPEHVVLYKANKASGNHHNKATSSWKSKKNIRHMKPKYLVTNDDKYWEDRKGMWWMGQESIKLTAQLEMIIKVGGSRPRHKEIPNWRVQVTMWTSAKHRWSSS